MTELELYNFIEDNNIHYRYNNGDDVLLFLNHSLIDSFWGLLGSYVSSEGLIEVLLKKNELIFHMNGICEYWGIELNKVFKNKEND